LVSRTTVFSSLAQNSDIHDEPFVPNDREFLNTSITRMRFALSLGLLFGSAHGWLASEGLASGLFVINQEPGTTLKTFSAFGNGLDSRYP
jgi:hypothetical protein